MRIPVAERFKFGRFPRADAGSWRGFRFYKRWEAELEKFGHKGVPWGEWEAR